MAADEVVMTNGDSTFAGKTVGFIMDHVKLVVIIFLIIIVVLLVRVGFPRLNKTHRIENMDLFLQENKMVSKAFEGVLSNRDEEIWSSLYGSSYIFGLIVALDSKVKEKYAGANDPYMRAMIDYYILYTDTVEQKSKEKEKIKVYCGKGKAGGYRIIPEKNIYSKYHGLKKVFGELFDRSASETQKSCKMHDENDQTNFVDTIYYTGVLITELAIEVKAITEVISKTNSVAFLMIPPVNGAESIEKNLKTYSSNLQEIYSPSFNSSDIHEYSWILFEALSETNPSFPDYDQKIKPLLINYLNSDAKKRDIVRTVLIQNDALCQFLERYPIYSRVMLSNLDSAVDKGNLYRMVCGVYRKLLKEYQGGGANASLSLIANKISKLKEFYSNIAVLDLYLNQYQSEHKRFNRDTIKSIYAAKYMDNREFFKYLWIPYFEDLVLNKILRNFYQIFTREYWEWVFLNKFYGFWLGLGNAIMNIPTSLAQNIANKRNFNKEKFVPESFTVEGFLGKIFAPIIAVGKFFMSLLKVVLVIVKLIMSFVKDPFGTLIDIFTLIIGTVLAVFLTIIYAIFSIPFINILPFALYFIITQVVPFFVFGFFYLFLFAIATIMIIVITFLNIISLGSLKKLSQCQNSPGAWYRTPNYHKNNRYERSIMCARPCPTGYAPDQSTGFMCLKLPRGMPNYCPKAEIMRIYTGYNRRDRKYTYPDYQTRGNMKYEANLPADREKILLTHFLKGESFFTECAEPMSKYDAFPRAICANIDGIREKAEEYGMSEKDIKKLQRVCNQAYCNARSGGAYTVCSNLSEKSGDDISQLVKNICMIISDTGGACDEEGGMVEVPYIDGWEYM